MNNSHDSDYEVSSCCRSCGSTNLVSVLDLGQQPLANALQKNFDVEEKTYPLSISFCKDCTLVQLDQTVKKEVLFDHYYWVTGTSAGAQSYAKTFFERAQKRADLKDDDLIVEIASNDGTFLRPFSEAGLNILGVDPAQNIAEEANNQGIRTLARYWDKEAAEIVKKDYGNSKFIFARNVIPHVSELHSVIEGIAEAMNDNSFGAIEFHYAGIILDELHYDSIYHEHLCYFSITALRHLLERYGLFSFHMDQSPISGGSYVIYFSKQSREATQEFQALLDKEQQDGVCDVNRWLEFAKQCEKHRKDTLAVVEKYKGEGLIGFGASARSSTFLNYCGLNHSDMKVVIDNNPLKQGMYTPGTKALIIPFNKLSDYPCSAVLILAWNFKDEIIESLEETQKSLDYIVPFPHSPEVIHHTKATHAN